MINLFYNYYKTTNEKRQKEIDFCLNKNLSNKNLNVIIIESQEALTYNYFFNQINKITDSEDINIISNSDIFLDDSILHCNDIKNNECYALCRWEYKSQSIITFANRVDSQDVWIFRGRVNNINGDFTLGKPGCDNRIAYEIKQAGYNIKNPSKTIKTYHVHNSNIRNYNIKNYKQQVVPGPYLTLPIENHLK